MSHTRLIVDANTFSEFYGNPTKEAGLILKWVYRQQGSLVVGGSDLKQEIARLPQFAEQLKIIKTNTAGRGLIELPDDVVDRECERIKGIAGASYNDPHILAVATISNASLLFSNDDKLVNEFRRLPGNRDAFLCATYHYRKLGYPSISTTIKKLPCGCGMRNWKRRRGDADWAAYHR